MSAKNNDKPVLILGAYGRGNVGDDVFTVTAATMLKNRKVYVNSADDSLLPEEVKDRLETISTTTSSDYKRKIKLFFSIKTVIYWGGDLWVELYGAPMPRQLLYKMLLVNCLLKLFGKKIYYVGCGIGPLTGYSLRLAKMSAGLSDGLILREARSAQLIGAKSTVMPDLAVNIPYLVDTPHPAPKDEFTIVISTLWSIPSPDKNFQNMIKGIANAVNQLPYEQVRIVLLPMHVNDDEKDHDDLWACKELRKMLNGNASIFTQRELSKVVTLLREADLVIGGRLHANIIGLLNSTPCIGLSYRPKVSSFFAENDLSEYCLDLSEVNRLYQKITYIHDNYVEAAEAFYNASTSIKKYRTQYQKLVTEMVE